MSHGRQTLGATPVLDIGGEVGALLVYLAAVPPGGELEACPADRPDARFHTGVHLRRNGAAEVAVAVFPEVREGRYTLLDESLSALASVDVTGGAVAELDLR
ncbi:MAG TPA: hypothetical protein VGF22_20515 [Acidimicrobiales bacterium]